MIRLDGEPYREPDVFVPTREFLPQAGEPVERILCTRIGSTEMADVRVECETAAARFPLPHRMVFHSQGFEFGYGGSGPAELALNLLLLLVRPEEALRLHQRVKRALVERIPRDGGVIELSTVRAWIEARWQEELADAELMAREEEAREFLAECARLDALAEAETGEEEEPAGAPRQSLLPAQTVPAAEPPDLARPDKDLIMAYPGLWRPARCRIRVWNRPEGTVVLATELPEGDGPDQNQGASVTNTIEKIATALCEQGHVQQPDTLILFEHYDDRDNPQGSALEGWARENGESFDRVRFRRVGDAFSDPEWTHSTKAEVEELIGGKLP